MWLHDKYVHEIKHVHSVYNSSLGKKNTNVIYTLITNLCLIPLTCATNMYRTQLKERLS